MSEIKPPPRIAASLGLAGTMGCFMALFAVATLVLGLLLDQALGTDRRVATLVCVLGGLPVNLIMVMWLTRKLIARVITPEASMSHPMPGASKSDTDVVR